jgi:hypothetical protein
MDERPATGIGSPERRTTRIHLADTRRPDHNWAFRERTSPPF